jgi:hypothetical protein
MAKNTNPIFESTPVLGLVSLAAANTARNGSGTIATLVTGAADGTRVDAITFISAQASAAANSLMVGRVFLSTDSGATWTLFDETVIAATTASNTAAGARNRLTYSQGIKLKDTTHSIGVTISVYAGVQDRTSVIAEGGDLTA